MKNINPTKRRYAKEEIDATIKEARKELLRMLDQVLSSGTLPDKWEGNNHMLVNSLFTIWGNRHKFFPVENINKKVMSELEQELNSDKDSSVKLTTDFFGRDYTGQG